MLHRPNPHPPLPPTAGAGKGTVRFTSASISSILCSVDIPTATLLSLKFDSLGRSTLKKKDQKDHKKILRVVQAAEECWEAATAQHRAGVRNGNAYALLPHAAFLF